MQRLPQSAHQPAIQLLLLAQVLLSCVDRQRCSSTFVADCRMTVAIIANALLYAVKQPGTRPDSGRLLVWLWWPEVLPLLPLLLRLMTHVQRQLLAADHQAAAAAAASSSSSGVQAGQRPGATAADPAMGSLVLSLVQLLADASIYTAADWGTPTAAAAAAGQPSSSRREAAVSIGDCMQLPKCWCKHSVQVSTALEGLLRPAGPRGAGACG